MNSDGSSWAYLELYQTSKISVKIFYFINVVYTTWKVSKYGVFSGPYFSTFSLNTERYSVSLRIQSECGKIRTRKHSVFGHFSRSVMFYVSDLNYEIQILGLPKSKCYTHAHVISLVRYTGSVKNVFSMLYHPDFDLTLLWYSALFCKHLEYQKHHTCLYRCYFVYLILIIQN